MLKIENAEVFGFEAAYRGMRNPLNSWGKASPEADLTLAKKLIAAGTEHRKFLRMIYVTVDVTAPLYWWKECDTYKVGTTANSCSTMHTLTKRPFTMDDFSFEDLIEEDAKAVVATFEEMRQAYNETKDQRVWRCLITLLPSGFMQRRTLGLNYEVLLSIHRQRKNHKLTEWHTFCDWIESLPSMCSFLEAAKGEA